MIDLILIIFIIGLPLAASAGIRATYNKYLQVRNNSGLTGQEVARKILDMHNLQSVYVVAVQGALTDHYDPKRKVVRLSQAVYEGTSVAAMAIAAHECGHAIQDQEGYAPMRLRSAIVPIVNIASSTAYWVILVGFLLQIANLIYLGIAFTCIGLLFQIITLPVEFDASNRAKKEIYRYNLATKEEQAGVKSVLTSAALTYVAGVLASALQVLRLILAVNRRR